MTSGPVYVGAIVVFLFVLGLFIVHKPTRIWLLGATILSIILAWGKNFEAFNYFMFDYFPGYNKFRAVSSALLLLKSRCRCWVYWRFTKSSATAT
jgi:hypothetical protein